MLQVAMRLADAFLNYQIIMVTTNHIAYCNVTMVILLFTNASANHNAESTNQPITLQISNVTMVNF